MSERPGPGEPGGTLPMVGGSPVSPPLHSRIGDYELLGELGRGGMGVVYEARRPELGRSVALKLVQRVNEVSRARFRREGELLARVRHPNVVVVHELGEAREGIFLVTERVEGTPLDECLAAGPLSHRRAAEILRDLADAVAALHELGVVHRDLKPENALLRPDGSPVLIDFGLALSDDSDRLTRTGAVVGTPQFMAPEQAAGRGAEHPDPRVDVYGLGGTLFNLLSGRRPFHLAQDIQSIMRAIADEEPGWDEHGLPPALAAIGRRAMAKDAGHRYASATDLRDDLTRYLEGEPVQALATRRLERGRVFASFAAVTCIGLLALAAIVSLRAAAEPPPQAKGGGVTTPVVPPPVATGASPPRSSAPLEWKRLRESKSPLREKGHRAVAFAGPRQAVVFDCEFRDQVPRLWDLEGSRFGPPLRSTARFPPGLSGLVADPAGRFILLGGVAAGPILKVTLVDGQESRIGLAGEKSRCMTVSPDGTQALVGTVSGRLLLIDLESGETVSRAVHSKTNRVDSVLLDPRVTMSGSGPQAVGFPEFEVIFWSRELREKRRISLMAPVVSLALNPNREQVAIGTAAGRIYLCDLEGGVPRALAGKEVVPDKWIESTFAPGREVPVAHTQGLRSVAFSADGRRLTSVARGGADDSSVLSVWDVETGAQLDSLTLGLKAADVVFSADGERLLLAGSNGRYELWEAR